MYGLAESVRRNVLTAKRPNPTSGEPNNRKRAKISKNNDTLSHEECIALKTENENLKREIQELKATMLRNIKMLR
jgi:predicted RNase H-like nuclease (RuvC/YqgF family)